MKFTYMIQSTWLYINNVLYTQVRRLLLADVPVVLVKKVNIRIPDDTLDVFIISTVNMIENINKCTHIYVAVTGRVTYNNSDEVHDDLSRRVCRRHVSRVCRRNPIFYLDVVKTIRQLIMSRTAWTLRRKDGIRQYKLNTGGRTRGIVIETNANVAKRYCRLSRKSRDKNNRMHHYVRVHIIPAM